MSTSKPALYTTSAYLKTVYTASEGFTSATDKVVAILRPIVWTDKEHVAAISREFRMGRMASILKLSHDEVAIVHDKDRFDPDAKSQGDGRKNKREQDAYNCGKSAWGHVARLAGKPTLGGKERPARPSEAGKKAAKIEAAKEAGKAEAQAAAFTPEVAKAVELSSVLTSKPHETSDVVAFARHIASLVHKFRQSTPKGVLAGPFPRIFEDFEVAIAKALATPEKATPAQIASKAPSEPVDGVPDLPAIPVAVQVKAAAGKAGKRPAVHAKA